MFWLILVVLSWRDCVECKLKIVPLFLDILLRKGVWASEDITARSWLRHSAEMRLGQLHAYFTKNCWFWTRWRSDKFLLLPGIEPLILSQYDEKAVPTFTKTAENNEKVDNQNRDRHSSRSCDKINVSESEAAVWVYICCTWVRRGADNLVTFMCRFS